MHNLDTIVPFHFTLGTFYHITIMQTVQKYAILFIYCTVAYEMVLGSILANSTHPSVKKVNKLMKNWFEPRILGTRGRKPSETRLKLQYSICFYDVYCTRRTF